MSHTETTLSKIMAEQGQTHDLRKPLIQEINNYFNCTTLSFYTTFDHWQGSIQDGDVTVIKDLLCSIGNNSRLLLIIHSPGGDPHSAERIVKTCKEWATETFTTLVPDKAKSAATMICLGSEKIYMTPTSELGPIDVQVPWGGQLLSAHVIIKSFEELMEKGICTGQELRLEPILQQLQRYDAAQMEDLRLKRDLAKEIAEKTLKEGMLKKVKNTALRKLLNQFLNPEALKSHSRSIFFTDIQKIDTNKRLQIECIEHTSPIFSAIHEYHQRVILHMHANGLSKVCETLNTSLNSRITTEA